MVADSNNRWNWKVGCRMRVIERGQKVSEVHLGSIGWFGKLLDAVGSGRWSNACVSCRIADPARYCSLH